MTPCGPCRKPLLPPSAPTCLPMLHATAVHYRGATSYPTRRGTAPRLAAHLLCGWSAGRGARTAAAATAPRGQRGASSDGAATAPEASGAAGATVEAAGASRKQRRVAGSSKGRTPGGSGGGSGSNASPGQEEPQAKPRRSQPRKTKATTAEPGGEAPKPLADTSGLRALFAQAFATASEQARPAVPAQPSKQRKRKVPTAAASADPFARYAGFFAVVAAEQQTAKGSGGKAARIDHSGSSTVTGAGATGAKQQQQQQQQDGDGAQQEQEQQVQQQQQQQQQAGALPVQPSGQTEPSLQTDTAAQQKQPAQSRAPPSSSRLAQRARALFGAGATSGSLSVQRLPTAQTLVPVTTTARSAAQQLAQSLLARPPPRRGPPAPVRLYVPSAGSYGAVAVVQGTGAARHDARSEALRRMRMRTINEYGTLLEEALEWEPEEQVTVLQAPVHLPVELQRAWPPPPAREPEASSTLDALGAEVQRSLGVALPERAVRGERGQVLAAVSPRVASSILAEWTNICGADYVRQLVALEPCVLAVRPAALLVTLDALNKCAGLDPPGAVAYVLRHPVLIGLDAGELEQRLDDLACAVGLAPNEARALALERPQLLMVR